MFLTLAFVFKEQPSAIGISPVGNSFLRTLSFPVLLRCFILSKTVIYLYLLYLCLMSVSQVYIIDELKQKIQLLAEKLERHKSAASALHSQNEDLEDKIREQADEINDLKKQNNTLKLSRAFVAESDEPQEAKLQINKIVREIDRCIALLNR
jgi:hypothetical protein